jgi:hypothetical protein
MRIGWLVNENHFKRAMSLRNGYHFPTTQCAMAAAAVKKIYTSGMPGCACENAKIQMVAQVFE